MFDEQWLAALENPEPQKGEQSEQDQPKLEDFFSPPPPPEPDWEHVRTILTEPRQIGLGEGLATEVWTPEKPPAPPEPEASDDVENPYVLRRTFREQLHTVLEEQRRTLHGLYHSEAVERAQTRIRKQAERWLGEPGAESTLMKRRMPDARYDARHRNYVRMVSEAHAKAKNALIDPYTDLIAEFAGNEQIEEAWERPQARSYAFASGANMQLGKLHVRSWSLRSAESAFINALKADAHDPEAWWYLGVVKLFRRKERDAVRALRTACDYRPCDTRCRIALGVAQYHRRNYAAAEDCFRYDKSSEGRGVGARSFLICSARMQGRWDMARMEIAALSQSPIPAWKDMADQCARCVDRGEALEGKRTSEGPQILSVVGILALIVAFVYWILSHKDMILSLVSHPENARVEDFIVPGVLVALALVLQSWRASRRRQTIDLYGDGKEDLPCWQTRSWMRPHRLDVFGQPMEIPRQ